MPTKERTTIQGRVVWFHENFVKVCDHDSGRELKTVFIFLRGLA